MPGGASRRRTCARCGGPARRSRDGSACPSRRSHRMVVSRWLVMPIAAISAAGHARLGQRVARRLADAGPDLLGVVLDPARLRVVLRQLGVAACGHGALGVDHQRGRARGALIERQDVAAGRHRWRDYSKITTRRSGLYAGGGKRVRMYASALSVGSLTVPGPLRTKKSPAALDSVPFHFRNTGSGLRWQSPHTRSCPARSEFSDRCRYPPGRRGRFEPPGRDAA